MLMNSESRGNISSGEQKRDTWRQIKAMFRKHYLMKRRYKAMLFSELVYPILCGVLLKYLPQMFGCTDSKKKCSPE